jgi:maltodextrin utilization protein YvdJ
MIFNDGVDGQINYEASFHTLENLYKREKAENCGIIEKLKEENYGLKMENKRLQENIQKQVELHHKQMSLMEQNSKQQVVEVNVDDKPLKKSSVKNKKDAVKTKTCRFTATRSDDIIDDLIREPDVSFY